jgi:hypothetical protein
LRERKKEKSTKDYGLVLCVVVLGDIKNSFGFK